MYIALWRSGSSFKRSALVEATAAVAKQLSMLSICDGLFDNLQTRVAIMLLASLRRSYQCQLPCLSAVNRS